MQKWLMANNIFSWDFLLQPLLHTLHLVILAFLSREVLIGPPEKTFRWNFLCFPVLGTQDIKE